MTEFEQDITCMHLFMIDGFLTAARDYALDNGDLDEIAGKLTFMIQDIERQIVQTPFGKKLEAYE